MTYFPHSQKDINDMLATIGIKSLDDLISPIPEEFRIDRLNLQDSKTELEVGEYFREISCKNREYSSIFMGAGAYNHFIPAAVDEISGRQEFYTSYTPYQAEISQGTLQAIFEYQTYIARLTGMDVSNASMYDGATSFVESIIMSLKITGKKKILVDRFIHPEYLETLRTYLKPINIAIDTLESSPASFDAALFREKWSLEYACFAVSNPNFLGSILDLSEVSDIVHNDRSIFIVVVEEALSLALLKSPGEYGADITCGEAQSFGIPLSFGGPYLGFISCLRQYVRRMPGRIAGQTVDRDGRVAYQLTLSTREQHIRRESATSNICSNHSLMALRSSAYLSLLGRKGLRECALKNIENSHYLMNKIKKLKKTRIMNNQIFFNEFVVETQISPDKIKKKLEEKGILSFLPLKKFYDFMDNSYLVCATEMNGKTQIDEFYRVLENL